MKNKRKNRKKEIKQNCKKTESLLDDFELSTSPNTYRKLCIKKFTN